MSLNLHCKTQEQFAQALAAEVPTVAWYANSGRALGYTTVDFYFGCNWEGEVYQAIYCFDERVVKKHGIELCNRYADEIICPAVARIATEANGLKIEEAPLETISFDKFLQTLPAFRL